jgi:alkanesulfonate monooxygenase SsuD/methylene tetrahydromethanopterin reductase-like flavin-dependent oxidoreductase (luciferase family)
MMAFRSDAESQLVAIVGDPSACKDQIARFREVGVDELILVMQLGTVPHETVMKSIRTFGEKVLPHFT